MPGVRARKDQRARYRPRSFGSRTACLSRASAKIPTRVENAFPRARRRDGRRGARKEAFERGIIQERRQESENQRRGHVRPPCTVRLRASAHPSPADKSFRPLIGLPSPLPPASSSRSRPIPSSGLAAGTAPEKTRRRGPILRALVSRAASYRNY